jgi:hypothetical protein
MTNAIFTPWNNLKTTLYCTVFGRCQHVVSKEKINMPQYRVGLICNDSRVLPELSNRLKEPWSTISEEEGMYYWSSSQFEALATVTEVDECATSGLSILI